MSRRVYGCASASSAIEEDVMLAARADAQRVDYKDGRGCGCVL